MIELKENKSFLEDLALYLFICIILKVLKTILDVSFTDTLRLL